MIFSLKSIQGKSSPPHIQQLFLNHMRMLCKCIYLCLLLKTIKLNYQNKYRTGPTPIHFRNCLLLSRLIKNDALRNTKRMSNFQELRDYYHYNIKYVDVTCCVYFCISSRTNSTSFDVVKEARFPLRL